MIENEIDFELAEVSDNGISIGWHGNAVLLRKGLSERACKGGIGSLPIWSDILVPDATC